MSRPVTHQLLELPGRPSGGDSEHTANAIAEQIAELMCRHTGRWPARVEASRSSGLVVLTLADSLTSAERQLVAAGHEELVLPTRDLVLRGMRADATAIVEASTQREVVAYITTNEPDLALIVFLLAP